MIRSHFAFVLVAAVACSAQPPNVASNSARASHRAHGCSAPDVHFAQGSAELTDEDREDLRELAQCLNRREINTVFVVGHTDPMGSIASNRDLGGRRAAAVATYLMSRGVSANFAIRSRGESGASSDEVLWPVDRSATITTSAR